MKTKRVGIISMGISLIATGLIMIMDQFMDLKLLELVSRLWPLLLISLGLELIYYNYKTRDRDLSLRLDFFSIFLVGMTIVVNLFLYTGSQLGLIYFN